MRINKKLRVMGFLLMLILTTGFLVAETNVYAASAETSNESQEDVTITIPKDKLEELLKETAETERPQENVTIKKNKEEKNSKNPVRSKVCMIIAFLIFLGFLVAAPILYANAGSARCLSEFLKYCAFPWFCFLMGIGFFTALAAYYQ